MYIKKGLICLLIVAMLMFCVSTVTAASTSKLANGTHNGYVTDVKSKQQTMFAITLAYPVGDGYYSTDTTMTTNINQPVCLWGVLNSETSGIGGATVNIQRSLDNNTWTTVFTFTTATGQYAGGIDVRITPLSSGNFTYRDITPQSSLVAAQTIPYSTAGVFYFRYTYDGDSQYAPCVSDVVKLTVVNSAQ